MIPNWCHNTKMNGPPVLIAVLDDESKMRSALRRLLQTHGFIVALFETGDEFLNAVQTHCPDCLLLDLHMPRMNGFDVLASMQSRRISTRAIVITGHDEAGNKERATALGARDYLLKPLDDTTLVNAIQRALEHAPGETS
jgi:two-component system response regulator FixJ